MAVTYIDPNESRDRRLQTLLQTASTISDMQVQKAKIQQQEQTRTFLQEILKNGGYPGSQGAQSPDRLLGSNIGFTGMNIDPVSGSMSMSFGETPQAKSQRETTQKNTENLNEFVASVPKVATALNSVEEAAKGLGDFKTGFMNQLWAKGSTLTKEFAQDPKVAEYVGVVGQNLSILARNIAEEKGPLTDNDIKRIEKGLGNKTAPLDTKLKLINELRDKTIESLTSKLQAAGTSYAEFVKGNPRVAQLMKLGKVMEDANGNRAMVYPDKSFEEL